MLSYAERSLQRAQEASLRRQIAWWLDKTRICVAFVTACEYAFRLWQWLFSLVT